MFTIAVESDMHCGSVYGLANPADVPTEYKDIARLLFKWREGIIKEVGKVDMLIHLGEVTDGPGHKSAIELYETDMDAQAESAADLMTMWNCNDYRMCFGSKYHTGCDSKTERMVVKELKLKGKLVDIKDTQRLNVDGVKINARHHSGASSTPQGKWSQLAKGATTDMLRGVYRDYPGADLYLRAHTHEFAYVGNDAWAAYNSPALQWPLGEYGLKMDRVWYTMGLMVIKIESGMWNTTPYLFKAKLPEETYANITGKN